jgi:cysteine sulfinate desulfinase/cysteine desulfurase-like protein
MHVPEELAPGTLRLSTGRITTEEEIDEAISILVDAVGRLRGERQG